MWHVVIGISHAGAVTCFVCEENYYYPGCTHAQLRSSCELAKEDHCTTCSKKVSFVNTWKMSEVSVRVCETRKVKKTFKILKEKLDINQKENTKSQLFESYRAKIKTVLPLQFDFDFRISIIIKSSNQSSIQRQESSE